MRCLLSHALPLSLPLTTPPLLHFSPGALWDEKWYLECSSMEQQVCISIGIGIRIGAGAGSVCMACSAGRVLSFKTHIISPILPSPSVLNECTQTCAHTYMHSSTNAAAHTAGASPPGDMDA